MKILPVHQGEPAWHQARAKYYRTASRAPTIMGANKYQTRNDLLRELATGYVAEIDANTQALFAAGHAAEAAMRPIVEGYLKAPLLPLTCITDDEYLLASFDGINETLRAGWEHKLLAAALMAAVKAKLLEPHYYWQCEQHAIVGDLDYVIFTCSDGTKENAAHMKYVPVPGRREQLLAAWRQFDADLVNYQHIEVIPAATAAPVMALPALSIQVRGEISLVDNLKVFGEKLTAFIARIPEKPSSDQEFADCKAACKALQDAQDALDAAEAHALGQISSFDEMKRTKAALFDLARSTRLAVEKMVTAREQQIKIEIVMDGKTAYAEHLAGLTKRIGMPMPGLPENFAVVIKGLRTTTSLQNAVATELARCKIEANAVADRISLNLVVMADHAEHAFLFADLAQLVLKAPDDFVLAIQARIQAHVVAEAKRLDGERDRIRAEEAAKAETEARARVDAEQRSQRDQAEAKVRQEREDQEIEDKRIQAALAAEEARLQNDRADAAKRQQVEDDRLAAVQARQAAENRTVEAERQKSLDIEQIITGLYERIKADKKYAGIAKAIIAYLAKAQKVAA